MEAGDVLVADEDLARGRRLEPTNSPSPMLRSTPATAVKLPKVLVTFSKTTDAIRP